MPFIHLMLNKNVSQELQQTVASHLLDITSSVLKKNPNHTAIVVDAPITNRSWFIGHSSQLSTMFKLEIYITEGTNSKEEKECWIAAVYQVMCDCLIENISINYIIVTEIPAMDWGYNGETQYARLGLAVK